MLNGHGRREHKHSSECTNIYHLNGVETSKHTHNICDTVVLERNMHVSIKENL
jgi:hypothetical protein